MKKIKGRLWLLTKLVVLDLAVFMMFFAVSLPTVKPMPSNAFLPNTSLWRTIIKKGLPNRLKIQSLSMDLPVGIGSYNPNSKDWTIDATQAYYADSSVPVNNINGTTLIYGHARWPIFGNLADLKLNAKASVYTSNGYVFNYLYQSRRIVLPSDISVFSEKGEPKLVLQTCYGIWDNYRALYYFKLESVDRL